jgi:hypothetical protein
MDFPQQVNNGPPKGEGICVGIRMRPLNERLAISFITCSCFINLIIYKREINSGQEKIFKCIPNSNAISHTHPETQGQIFYYDKV